MAITPIQDTVNYLDPAGVRQSAKVVVAVNADGSSVGSGDLLASIGSPSDAAWNGTDPNATVISLLKAIAVNTEGA